MTKGQKFTTYSLGFVIGCLILFIIPKKEPNLRREKWHAQTAPDGYYPLSITDDFGRKLTFERQPRHFISLAPSVTEILFAMDMGDHLVAVTEWCSYPKEAKALRDAGAQIGSMNQPNRELIASYWPDIIIGTNFTPVEMYALLQNEPGTIAVALKHDGMNDVLKDIEKIGLITGVPGNALRLINQLKEKKELVDQRIDAFKNDYPRSALFLLSLEESLSPGWSPGKNTWIGDMISELNAVNTADSLGQEWGQPSFESLLALNPEVLIVREPEAIEEKKILMQRINQLPEHPVWSQISAIRQHRVFLVPYGPFTIPGPRMFDAYAELANAIWPESTSE